MVAALTTRLTTPTITMIMLLSGKDATLSLMVDLQHRPRRHNVAEMVVLLLLLVLVLVGKVAVCHH